mmetsp:Transcript_63560/g.125713  ORF Transcript_63560/g.125713 Transcript_63560/m.125713 type:complete len:108 (+) Transcript_63560:265-588(+)
MTPHDACHAELSGFWWLPAISEQPAHPTHALTQASWRLRAHLDGEQYLSLLLGTSLDQMLKSGGKMRGQDFLAVGAYACLPSSPQSVYRALQRLCSLLEIPSRDVAR